MSTRTTDIGLWVWIICTLTLAVAFIVYGLFFSPAEPVEPLRCWTLPGAGA